MSASDSTDQERPESFVAAIRNLPSTGSLTARPRLPPG